jgi:hypothetical protein
LDKTRYDGKECSGCNKDRGEFGWTIGNLESIAQVLPATANRRAPIFSQYCEITHNAIPLNALDAVDWFE